MCTVIVSAALLCYLSTSSHLDLLFHSMPLYCQPTQNLFPFLTFTHFGSCQCIHCFQSSSQCLCSCSIFGTRDSFSQWYLLFFAHFGFTRVVAALTILAHCFFNFGVAVIHYAVCEGSSTMTTEHTHFTALHLFKSRRSMCSPFFFVWLSLKQHTIFPT